MNVGQEDYIVALFQEGLLCKCGKEPIWDRIYDADNKLLGYELQHKTLCEGRIKAAEMLREIKETENVEA